jgi:hypothetical protein
MDFSIIQGHPIAGARTPFKSIATISSNVVAHDCMLLVSDKTYERIVFAYRLLSQGSMQCVYDGLLKTLNKAVQKQEIYYWNSVSLKYNLVTTLTSVDINNLLIGVMSNGNKYKLGLDAICPYSSFTNPNIPYKLISFAELSNLSQQGLIVKYEVNQNYQKYFGLTNEPNKIVTVFDRYGNGYIVKGKLESNGMIYPPV